MMQNLKIMGTMVKCKLRTLFSDEKGEVNIVAIVVLIGIAVVLAVIFRDAIAGLLSSLFETITENANDAISSTSKPKE